MNKRGNFSLSGTINKKQCSDDKATRSSGGGGGGSAGGRNAPRNPFLTQPVDAEQVIKMFLIQARSDGRRFVQNKGMTLPLKEPLLEIEARLGTLKSPFGMNEMRISPSGPQKVIYSGKPIVAHAFLCNNNNAGTGGLPTPNFQGGITRSHYTKRTLAGLSEVSPVSNGFGIQPNIGAIRNDLKEVEYVETVYGGLPNDSRACFPGVHPPPASAGPPKRGKLEKKQRLCCTDVAIPSADYDLRLTLASEQTLDGNLNTPPPNSSTKRLKRRRSYCHRNEGKFAWQLDVTEVSTSGGGDDEHVLFELEAELLSNQTLKLINCNSDEEAKKLCVGLAGQLWWMMRELNPMSDVLEVDSFVRTHPDSSQTKLALAQCLSLNKFMENKQWEPVIAPSGPSPTPRLPPHPRFPGCMPVNFQRHNIDDVQRSGDRGYYLSEKTDGVRYLMVFTGSTVVLVDRAMGGNQPIPIKNKPNEDPMGNVVPLIQPGTVFDGEVVINRKAKPPRPLFIVFDILCCGNKPILNLPFEKRLEYLKHAAFKVPNSKLDSFDLNAVGNPSISLPLVRKNFVRRTQIKELLSYVHEERGERLYRNGPAHNHKTDGIIFQHNGPYKMGTDVNLLKWKYLDTVTIDVEIMPPNQFNHNEDDSELRLGVVAEEGIMVEMSRFIKLPPSERLRLEADRNETKAKIAEVGFNPQTGEWYYLTMRPDKIASNHISTVLGTLLELAESLGTDELQYRLSTPPNQRDTYFKDIRGMWKQMLKFQQSKYGK